MSDSDLTACSIAYSGGSRWLRVRLLNLYIKGLPSSYVVLLYALQLTFGLDCTMYVGADSLCLGREPFHQPCLWQIRATLEVTLDGEDEMPQ